MMHGQATERQDDSAHTNAMSAIEWDVSSPLGYNNRSGVYKTRVQFDFIRRLFPKPPARVLDVAGGCGRFRVPLPDAGYDVTVNDIHLPSLQLLQSRCSQRQPNILHGDFLKLGGLSEFDCVLAMECLDHMPFREVLSRVHRVLKPGGVFVFTVLNAGSWRFALRRLAGRAASGEFVMRSHEYRDACERAQFEVVDVRGLMWSPFTVISNSPLVPVCARLESALRLYALERQSPWLLLGIRRS